jgi:hypothetical protein
MDLFCKIAFATTKDIDSLLLKINEKILNPVIYLMFGFAIMFFLWGVVDMIAGANNEEKRATGRQHMIWGIVGLFIMLAVGGIIQIIVNFWKGI